MRWGLSRKAGAIAAAVVVLLGWVAYEAPRVVAAPVARWEWRNPYPQGNDLNAVAWGNGVFVAVGEYGAVVTSHDGLDWRPRSAGTDASLAGVAYGAGRFVAVGGERDGAGVILVSGDGVEWSRCDYPDGVGRLVGVAFDAGRFVAVGPGGVIAESRDGLSWSLRAGGPAPEIMRTARGGGRLVAVGKGGSILYSNDGQSWHQALRGSTQRICDAAFGAGVFVAVGDGGTVHASTDGGLTWTVASLGPEWSLLRVAYGHDRFVAVGYDGLRAAAFISRDSLIWSGPYVIDGVGPSRPEFTSMAYNGGKFTLIECVSGAMLESADGADWLLKGGRFAGVRVRDMAAGGGVLAVVGCAEAPAEIAVGDGAVERLADGVILTSSDGEYWAVREHPALPELRCVAYGEGAYGDGRFVAAGDGGVTLAWGDGAEWSLGRIGADFARPEATAYGGGWFVVAGEDGRMFATRDGTAWNEITPGRGWRCARLAFGGGRLVAVGDGGTIFTGSVEEDVPPERTPANRRSRPIPD